MSECTHDCGSCDKSCQSRDMHEKPHELTRINKIIGIVSGKGGVGKTLVTCMLAVEAERLGYKAAVLDADITGPSVPRTFGISGKRATGSDLGLMPVETAKGIKVMSLNLLTENETDPVVWRGPIIAGTVKQFWTDVIWGDNDFMFVDMPPGTGDVPLTVFQTIPLDGIVIVASPQELVSMVVEKAVNMAEMMNVPILGVVENMSYVVCPDCGKRIEIFGKSHVDEIALRHGLPVLARIPFDASLAALADGGLIECHTATYLDPVAPLLDDLIKKSKPRAKRSK